MGEITTGAYTLIDIPVPKQQLVHIHAGAEELGRVYHPTLAINASPVGVLSQLAKLRPDSVPTWQSWTSARNENYLENLKHPQTPGDVQMGDIMQWLRGHLKPDAILTMGAGNYTAWAHRFYQYRSYRSQLGPTNGSMGYGVPAAVAAKITMPERTVVAFVGDGCFLMNGQELATAMQYDARVIFLVINNGMYGTIRMHQERNFPGRPSGTSLTNPDFAALARSYGLHGEIVEKTADFSETFQRCEASRKPSLIEIRIDPEALTVKQSLSQIREQAITQGK